MEADRPIFVEYDYDALREFHSVEGAFETLRTLFPKNFPRSVLDFGCGIGTWLKAALECGAQDVLGIEGVPLRTRQLLVPKTLIRKADLNRPFDAGRSFDLVLCLEVAEHLEPRSADILIDTLTSHGPLILFSAAAPSQHGTHHVNCRWPSHWQHLFNERGFACSDSVRWEIWNNDRIEPWYRQNLMMVTRNEALAGKEPRIEPVLHPGIVEYLLMDEARLSIEEGSQPLSWYLAMPFRAAGAKLRRRLKSAIS